MWKGFPWLAGVVGGYQDPTTYNRYQDVKGNSIQKSEWRLDKAVSGIHARSVRGLPGLHCGESPPLGRLFLGMERWLNG